MLTIFRNFFSPPRHMILLLLAAWAGLTLAEKRAERHGIGKEDLNNIVFYGLLGFVIGGRIFFVIENLSAFIKSPLGIFSINPDLFDVTGGIAAAVITALVYGQGRNIKFWSTLDALTPFFSVLAIGLGLSHLAAGTFFGKETDLPFGINLWSAIRHPTQIYETIAALLIFGWVWRAKENRLPGIFFLLFTALISLSQIIIQTFRADSAMIFGVNQAQVIAWFVLAACFTFIEVRLKEPSKF